MYDTVEGKYKQITEALIARDLKITTMESCTSGLIASLITDTEGASAVMRGAFVTYSNEAKIRCGVPAEVIEKYGVYSEETAEAMARAAASFYDADIAIGVTGSFANADPENADSVPGKVYFAICFNNQMITKKKECTYTITDVHGSCRHDDKMIVADYIADELLKLLETT